jgi:MFS family permease
MASGFYTDRLQRRKGIAVGGYLVTAIATASFAFATNAWHVLAARAVAWLGRGVRTPVRKALLAASVSPHAYGRAFGLERMMDTSGAIVGPLSALFLLQISNHNYRFFFLCTLLPGLLAAAVIALLVRENKRAPVPHISFGELLRLLPSVYRRFLVAVGLFGSGDFAHTLLILLATQKLTLSLGLARATTVAVTLYILHNVFYAAFSFVSGWLADRMRKNLLLAIGYALAGLMAIAIVLLPASLWSFLLVFGAAGIYVAIEETLEDSLCAELVPGDHHGMAFGVLATVNGIGDFLSSIIVGALWSAFGTRVAFGYSAVLFFSGALLVARLQNSHPPGPSDVRLSA